MTAQMKAPPLEAWPELGEFLRELVRREVDAQKTATTDGLIAFIRKHVRAEVDSAIAAAVDGLMSEVLDSIGQVGQVAPRPPPVRRRREGEWITALRAGRIANVKPNTILRWIRDGRLKRFGTRQRVLVSRAELRALLSAGAHGTGHAWATNGHAP